ncbi:MAG: peptide chain release factor N(5)-glutamine methyltransferase [Alphaproteobacteria bacterium]|nr:MAG: peptide chain release factor N(5)-glutamine methyltransferase [Alphaproteobacteria bacterium]
MAGPVHKAIRDAARILATSGVAGARLDAEVLAAHALGRERLALLSDPPDRFDGAAKVRFDTAVAARAAGVPVAYLTGSREFYGLEFAVGPGVLIPRPDSETLVEAVLAAVPALAPARRGALRILDLGVGSGCLLLSLLHALPAANGVGVDICPVALACAQGNARRLGLAARARFLLGDWWAALDGTESAFDIVIANPPYILRAAIAALAPAVRDYEPHLALDGGDDGLDAYRAIMDGLPLWLASPGIAAIEIGHDQAPAVMALMAPGARAQWSVRQDLAGRDRVLCWVR